MPTAPVFTQRLTGQEVQGYQQPQSILSLTADERTKSRHCFQTAGRDIHLQLPRGTVLRDGDVLRSADGQHQVQVVAQSEPVLKVTGLAPAVMRAAYHLGNRHVPVEVFEVEAAETGLRLAPDPVLRSLLVALGLTVADAVEPFHPESGAYGQSHSHHGGPTHG